VKHGVNINKKSNNGATPLISACQNGHIKVVKYLVENGVDINKEENNGETPLFYACLNGNEDIIQCLIKRGAYISKKSINKYSKEIIKLLQNFENEKRKNVRKNEH